jgi:Coenzyme PQQ synthesis protein D (PqqD)
VRSESPIARSEDLLVEELGDELLVYDRGCDEAHSLDASAAAIWRACDGTKPVSAIASDLVLEEAVVQSTVEQLGELGLLLPGSFETAGHSRRALLRHGLVAGAAGVAAVPVIRSIVAPSAAQAQTLIVCAPHNDQCGVVTNGTCSSTLPCCDSSGTCLATPQAPDGTPCICFSE